MKTNHICPYPGVSCAIEHIDPTLAQALVATNPDHQRKIARGNIEKIAGDMANGRFHLTGEPIIIGKSGSLLDGQHRLYACINTKQNFWCVVVRGIDDEFFHLIDTGKGRTLSDILKIKGEKDNSNLATTLIRVAEYIKGSQYIGGSGPAISVGEAIGTLEMMPSIRESLTACRNGKASDVVAATRIAWLHCLAHENRPDIAPEFFEKLFDGTNLQDREPVYLLRARLIADKMSKAKLPVREVLALIVKAWNAYVRDESPRVLKWVKTEAFPELIFDK